MFRAEAVWHHYFSEPALRDLTLAIKPGEYVAVLGRNGSGKSTLARCADALLLPSAGRVFVMGLPTDQPEFLWTIRQSVGMVFQNPDNQLVGNTVQEDVAFGPENLGLPPDRIVRRVEQALDAVRLGEFRQRDPNRLSGGQQQRVAIAGVLALQPRCLVLDEATSMLDPAGRQEVLGAVRSLHREQGLTVIHITQDLREAVEADRVVVLEAGEVVLDGRPREVFQEADRLQALGLGVPPAADIAGRLRNRGVPLPGGLLTVEELVEALCRLRLAQ